MEKNLLICKKFILENGLTTKYYVGNLFSCTPKCYNTSFYF